MPVVFYLLGLSISAVAEINNKTPPATAAEIKLLLLNQLNMNPKTATTNNKPPSQRSIFINKFISYNLSLLISVKELSFIIYYTFYALQKPIKKWTKAKRQSSISSVIRRDTPLLMIYILISL